MTCHEAKELSSDYLDQRLSPMKITLIEEHLKSCIDCSQELEALRHTVSFIGSLDEIETSADFLTRVRRKIESGNRKKRVWAWLFEPTRIKIPIEVAALFLVSVTGIYLYYRSPELTPKGTTAAPAESLMSVEPSRGKEFERKKRQPAIDAALKQEPPSFTKEEARESQTSSPEAMRAPQKEAVAAAPQPEILELFVEDIARSAREVNALVEQVNGRLLAEERAPGSAVLLTVEVPLSRKPEFLAVLKPGSDLAAGQFLRRERMKSQRDPFGAAGQTGVPASKAASAPSPEVEEPMVRLHLRVLPKK